MNRVASHGLMIMLAACVGCATIHKQERPKPPAIEIPHVSLEARVSKLEAEGLDALGNQDFETARGKYAMALEYMCSEPQRFRPESMIMTLSLLEYAFFEMQGKRIWDSLENKGALDSIREEINHFQDYRKSVVQGWDKEILKSVLYQSNSENFIYKSWIYGNLLDILVKELKPASKQTRAYTAIDAYLRRHCKRQLKEKCGIDFITPIVELVSLYPEFTREWNSKYVATVEYVNELLEENIVEIFKAKDFTWERVGRYQHAKYQYFVSVVRPTIRCLRSADNASMVQDIESSMEATEMWLNMIRYLNKNKPNEGIPSIRSFDTLG